MKFAVVLAAVLAVSAAQLNRYKPGPRPSSFAPRQPNPAPARPAPARASSSDQAANIVRYESDINPDGSYTYSFETDNGIAAQEQGTPRDFGGNPPLTPVVAQGYYSYTAPGGEPISISYIADENGYQPTGDAIPTPPPVPPQIARALEYLARVAPKK